MDMIIERVTGHHWWDEVTRRVVRPLRLTRTSWPGLSPAMPRPYAHAYQPFPDGAVLDVTEHVVVDPEGAITSTTRDLNRFFRALLGGRCPAAARTGATPAATPATSPTTASPATPCAGACERLVSGPLCQPARKWRARGGWGVPGCSACPIVR